MVLKRKSVDTLKYFAIAIKFDKSGSVLSVSHRATADLVTFITFASSACVIFCFCLNCLIFCPIIIFIIHYFLLCLDNVSNANYNLLCRY